jgi:hypothetical protein
LAKTGVKVKGVSRVIQSYRKFTKTAEAEIFAGLRVWGENTMTISKDEFTPVKRGYLRGSGTVESRRIKGNPAVELSFGGESPADEYAVYVHEIPAEHPVGEDKYLEKAVMQEMPELVPTIKRVVKRRTGVDLVSGRATGQGRRLR